MSPSPENFLIVKLETVQAGVHLKPKSIFFVFMFEDFKLPHFLSVMSANIYYIQTCLKNSGVCRIYSQAHAGASQVSSS